MLNHARIWSNAGFLLPGRVWRLSGVNRWCPSTVDCGRSSPWGWPASGRPAVAAGRGSLPPTRHAPPGDPAPTKTTLAGNSWRYCRPAACGRRGVAPPTALTLLTRGQAAGRFPGRGAAPPAPFTPELQPAEALWPLLREAVAYRSISRIDRVRAPLRARLQCLPRNPEAVQPSVGFGWATRLE